MEQYTDAWRDASRRLTAPLRAHHVSSDMGASAFVLGSRRVTIKHRMRKDRVAVVTLGCWTGDDRSVQFLTTTAMPEGDQAEAVGRALLAFLDDGRIPSLDLPTFPGYETPPASKWSAVLPRLEGSHDGDLEATFHGPVADLVLYTYDPNTRRLTCPSDPGA